MKKLKYIRFPVVKEITGGCSITTLKRWMNKDLFPKSYKIGPNITAWCEDEVLAWAKQKAENRK